MFFNLGFLTLVGFGVANSLIFQRVRNRAHPPIVAAEQIATIYPTVATAPRAETDLAFTGKPRFARTAPEQASERPEKPAFIGERDTQATSDRKPDSNAAALPSQNGIIPKSSEDYETIESNYQDGALSQNNSSAKSPPQPNNAPLAPQQTDTTTEESLKSGKNFETHDPEKSAANPPQQERLMEGPNPVVVSVPNKLPKPERTKPSEQALPRELEKLTEADETLKPKPQPAVNDPAFAGYQRKSAIVGSITRNGQSALAVENTALGRYQAIISRAVELEWQRNCVRHRDFITPGFLTVRFFVETSGRVRTVQFVGEMETGEIQKGFTLNSIRDATIPPMPTALKKEYTKDPLELIFNFYF